VITWRTVFPSNEEEEEDKISLSEITSDKSSKDKTSDDKIPLSEIVRGKL
jgi:hypothetical protein